MTPPIATQQYNEDFLSTSYTTALHHFFTPFSQEDYAIPLSIFKVGMSGLEALTVFLKESKHLRFCQIARLLRRDDRTIWDSYTRAKKKHPQDICVQSNEQTVPLSIFQNRMLGVLESISEYLREECHLRFCDIAVLLSKNDRTVWTAYHRAKKKRKATQNE